MLVSPSSEARTSSNGLLLLMIKPDLHSRPPLLKERRPTMQTSPDRGRPGDLLLFSSAYACHARKYLGTSAASRTPTRTFHPPSSSSSSPLICATPPGMTMVRWLTFSSMPIFLTKVAIASATNLPAAHDVSTDWPSVSITNSQVGTLLPSISPATVK